MPNQLTKRPKKKRKLSEAEYANLGAIYADLYFKQQPREPEQVKTYKDIFKPVENK